MAIGSPVLTLQMMHPIKIEVEVSADQSREIQRRRQIPITFEGQPREQNAFLYMIDPSADPATRTFTVTMLLLNEQFRPALPQHLRNRPYARTEDIWPLNLNEIVGAPRGAYVVEESAIVHGDDGSYVWQVINAQVGQKLPEILEVQKRPVQPLKSRIRFLGEWVFQQVQFDSVETDSAIPLTPTTMICGHLEFPDGNVATWDGHSAVVEQRQQWMLRPGDLVNVNLSDQNTTPGYYVPVEAIYEELGSTYVFVIDEGVARKTEIKAYKPEKMDNESQIQIEPLDSEDFAAGLQIVLGGVHYLKDGDRIAVIDVVEGSSQSLPPTETRSLNELGGQ